ncbi:EF-P 5-aminopentanol modification-associated protein YfmH [Candidatus Contubernalis alkaliaceticus]|uniref:EF-P 5-aminopentanol modification-associated protein YfmH n=1 Tax=Candidatus Contubernalis alkaliaceticus TaxID=338645 RepID=UPI001F4BF014|nr:pitrilysin family protein [Candidatus Contubernalis alkalaceticus]UNC91473.1 insulinase family protein [Candidatus Contubernalis alkalaceticus]
MAVISERLLKNDTIQEKVHVATLYPGLEVFVFPKKGYNKKYASFATQFGSIDNSFYVEGNKNLLEVPDGVAHFLEHKLFEGEKGNVFDEFARKGASANAYTNFTMTNYLFSSTDNFEDCFDLLINFVQDPYFTAESVEKEKGIIAQEIRMYEDNPGWRLFFNLLGCLYSVHPVRKDIAGTVESIMDIDEEILYKCYRTFYHPSNMALFVVGDLEPERVIHQVMENLEHRDYQPLGEIKRIYPEEPQAVRDKCVREKMEVYQPLLSLGFKDRNVGFTGRDLFKKELASELVLEMLFGKSTETYNRLYEEGLINDQFGTSFVAEKDYAYTMMGGETPDPDKLYQALLDSITQYIQKGFKEEDFERQRRKMLGEFLRNFNSLEFIANNFLYYHFRENNLFDFVSLLQEMKAEDIHLRLRELFDKDYHSCSIITSNGG